MEDVQENTKERRRTRSQSLTATDRVTAAKALLNMHQKRDINQRITTELQKQGFIVNQLEGNAMDVSV